MTDAVRRSQAVLVAAIAMSIIHYADNTIRFDQYVIDDGSVPRAAIPIAWVAFTSVGFIAYRALSLGRVAASVRLLLVYSLSGLIGLLHYRNAPPASFDAFQNVFIVGDVILGGAVIFVAVVLQRREARSRRRDPAEV